jgi:two-component system NtrC family sensor kinase
MTEPVLIVDDDPFVLGLLTHVGETRGMDVTGVHSADEAEAALSVRPYAVVVVDLLLGESSGLDLIKRLRQSDASIETVVISADRRLSSALESYELEVFAFLPKPLDPSHVFTTVERAMERRRQGLERRRLNWELGLLNRTAEIVTSSLDLDDVLSKAVRRVSEAFDARWAYVRLTPAHGGAPEIRAALGADVPTIRGLYEGEHPKRPSEVVFETGQPMRKTSELEPLEADGTPPIWRSTISVPITAGDQLLGVLTMASDTRPSFTDDDERVLMLVGRQFGVAVSNAHLYERVHRAKLEWERTFDAISDPIAVFDAQRRTMRVNTAMAALRGWAINATQGRSCEDVGLCGGGDACMVSRALTGALPETAEVVSGEDRVFTVTAVPVPGQDAAVLFAREVTEERHRARQLRALSAEVAQTNEELNRTVERLRSTQAQLVQSEKLSAIGQLVAGVAHELNNPLTSIIGYTQLVQEAVSHNPVWAASAAGMLDDIGRVLSESERAARIVRNLLTFARRQSTARSASDVAELCRRVVALRAYDHQVRGLAIETSYADDLPAVLVDDTQIQQALLNLILNAEQAMKDVAEPRIVLRAERDPEACAVKITISDIGHGIAPENLPRVFDPFFTTRGVGEGTGLGLSIVYGIVRDHGGQVWAESDGRGATFAVRLPAIDPAVGAHPPPVGVAHADAVTRDYLAAVLAGWGYRPRTAAAARDALALCGDGLALLVLDPALVEPDVDGWRAAAASGRPALIALDASHVEPDAARFLRETAAYVVAPPFDLPRIRRAVLAARGHAP